MKKNKVFGLGISLGVLLSSGIMYASTIVNDVYISRFPIILNGKTYNTNMPVLNYQGRTYLALRELGTVTGNEVDFIDDKIIINNNLNVTVSFDRVEYERITNKENNYSFIKTKENVNIMGMDKNIAEKIESKLDEIQIEIGKDVTVSEDEIIYEGFEHNQGYTLSYKSDDIISFTYQMEGWLGGSSWFELRGYNFSLKTGELISIDDIVKEKEEFFNKCKEIVENQLLQDERYEEVKEFTPNYMEVIINEVLKGDKICFAENGIEIYVEKYTIASGAAGNFVFEIPYSEIEGFLEIK